ncbi:hypothetical protein [Stenotrophomonas sp. NPDC077659]|uniref:hypothetical protein n=1 Tax=Stenotrophomonas sp. NPDC077659 TaxID=3390694 RepID=UPI003CFC0F55
MYRKPPLPPAATFALRRVEGAPSGTVDPTRPALPLLAAMAEHRARHGDTFQWRPLLLAGMPYSPRRAELHPYGIQARLSGEAMGADEPPVIRHTPAVFAERVAVHQFQQLLGAYAQIIRDADTTASPRCN